MVESNGLHGLSCKDRYLGKKSRHGEINNFLKRALVQARIPAINEPSNLSRKDGKRPDGLTLTREKVKISHYKELANDYCFIPVAVETFGSWGQEGYKLVKEIGKKVMEETGERRSTFYLFQNISISIQRGNAACIIGTVPHSEGLEEIFEFETNYKEPQIVVHEGHKNH